MSQPEPACIPLTIHRPPEELLELERRIRKMAAPVRDELVPILEDAKQAAEFRDRVLWIAREAIERQRLELKLTQFDLEATRREREALRREIQDRN